MNDKLTNPLLTATKRVIRIGETLKVYLAATPAELAGFSPAIEKEIARALKRGETVTENGVARWLTQAVITNPGASGSAAFVWNGDRVKVRFERVTRSPDGTLTREPAGEGWREFGEM